MRWPETMPKRSEEPDVWGGEWTCALSGKTPDCPYEEARHDCTGCAFLLVGGVADPNMPALSDGGTR